MSTSSQILAKIHDQKIEKLHGEVKKLHDSHKTLKVIIGFSLIVILVVVYYFIYIDKKSPSSLIANLPTTTVQNQGGDPTTTNPTPTPTTTNPTPTPTTTNPTPTPTTTNPTPKSSSNSSQYQPVTPQSPSVTVESIYNFFYTLGKLFCYDNSSGNCTTNSTSDSNIKSNAPGYANTQRLMSWIFYSFLDIPISTLPNLTISNPITNTTIDSNETLSSQIQQYAITLTSSKYYFSNPLTANDLKSGINNIPQNSIPSNGSANCFSGTPPSGNVTWLACVLYNLGTKGLSRYNRSDYTYTPSSSGTYSLSATKAIASSLLQALYKYDQTKGIVFSQQSPLYSLTN